LNLYGYDRKSALRLPSWEFWLIYDTHVKNKALDLLDQRQAIGSLLTENKRYLDNLCDRAGLNDSKPKDKSDDVPWTLALAAYVTGSGG
jgi:hypothetical protein